MKKLLLGISSIGIVATPVMAIVACSDEGEIKFDDLELKETLDSGKPQNKKIGFVNYNGGDTFMKTVQTGIEKSAKDNGIDIITADATNDPTKLIQAVETQIAAGVNGVIVNLVDVTTAIPVIQKAAEARIPIILVNKEIAPTNREKEMNSFNALAYVGSKPEESGEAQAELIYQDLKDGIIKDKDSDGKIDFVVLGGQKDHADATARSLSVRSKLLELIKAEGVGSISGTSNIEVDPTTKNFSIKKGLTDQDYKVMFEDHSSDTSNETFTGKLATFVATTGEADWSVAGGQKVIQGLEDDNVKLDFVAANNDDTGLGAVEELANDSGNLMDTEAKLTAYAATDGSAPWTPIYGVDANTTAVASIKAGKLAGTVKQDGNAIGQASVVALAGLMQGNVVKNLKAYMTANGVSAINQDSEADFVKTRAFRVPYTPISREAAKKL